MVILDSNDVRLSWLLIPLVKVFVNEETIVRVWVNTLTNSRVASKDVTRFILLLIGLVIDLIKDDEMAMF